MRRDFMSRPHDFTRHQRHSRYWRDLHGERTQRDDEFREARGFVDALILGMVVWAIVLIPIGMYLGWF